MNRLHRYICRSSMWSRTLSEQLMPWALQGVELGDALLEIGPGPGLATDVLRGTHAQVTSLEIDTRLASALRERMHDTNVTVIEGDATDMPFPDASFSGAVAFTMLHHVPSPELQDRLLAETARVLRPGAWFAGTDSISSRTFEWLHLFDTLVPVDPDGFAVRLEKAGFTDADVSRASRAFRFRARRA